MRTSRRFVFAIAAVATVVVMATTQPSTAQASATVFRPAVVRGNHWLLRTSTTGGPADGPDFVYGDPGDRQLMCDWDGDGVRTPGVRRGITFFMRNSNSSGVADSNIQLGNPGDTPICGDWDGNGTETIGLVRGNEWFLFNLTGPGADPTAKQFFYGEPGDAPLVGDWDANGTATPGVRRGITFFLTNSTISGPADADAFLYGNPGDVPLSGDWDGDGSDTVGLKRGNTWFLSNGANGSTASSFVYGEPNDLGKIWYVIPSG